jgi:hypothetical protein
MATAIWATAADAVIITDGAGAITVAIIAITDTAAPGHD